MAAFVRLTASFSSIKYALRIPLIVINQYQCIPVTFYKPPLLNLRRRLHLTQGIVRNQGLKITPTAT